MAPELPYMNGAELRYPLTAASASRSHHNADTRVGRMGQTARRTHFEDVFLDAVWDAEWHETQGETGSWYVTLNGHDLASLEAPTPTEYNAAACKSALDGYIRECWNRLPFVWFVRSLHEKVGDWEIEADQVDAGDGSRVWRVRINGGAGMLTPFPATGTQPAREVREAIHAWLQRTWGIPDP